MINSQSSAEVVPVARRLVVERGVDGVLLRFFADNAEAGEVRTDDGRGPIAAVLIPEKDIAEVVELLDEQLRREAERMMPSDELMQDLVRRSPPMSEWTE